MKKCTGNSSQQIILSPVGHSLQLPTNYVVFKDESVCMWHEPCPRLASDSRSLKIFGCVKFFVEPFRENFVSYTVFLCKATHEKIIIFFCHLAAASASTVTYLGIVILTKTSFVAIYFGLSTIPPF